jgi:hypothetical protein
MPYGYGTCRTTDTLQEARAWRQRSPPWSETTPWRTVSVGIKCPLLAPA